MLSSIHTVRFQYVKRHKSFSCRNVANELAVAGRSGGGTQEAYHAAVEHALSALEPFKADIGKSVQMQGPLLEQIFAENER